MTDAHEPLTDAGRHWAEQLRAWALPDEIVAQAAVPPWAHDPKTFAVDDTLRPDSPIFAMARASSEWKRARSSVASISASCEISANCRSIWKHWVSGAARADKVSRRSPAS